MCNFNPFRSSETACKLDYKVVHKRETMVTKNKGSNKDTNLRKDLTDATLVKSGCTAQHSTAHTVQEVIDKFMAQARRGQL